MATTDSIVRIRMYRQGLGDCFLLTFRTGPKPVHVLVDCGTMGVTPLDDGSQVTMGEVVADIRKQTGDHIDLLIATHEHKDHVLGFDTQRAEFDKIKVDHVWAAWTEDAKDDLAKDVEKFEGDLAESLRLVSEALRAGPAADDELSAVKSGIDGFLDLVGDAPGGEALLGPGFSEPIHKAMLYAITKGKTRACFLSPGKVIEPSWLPGVRFYVLGPPRDPRALAVTGTDTSPDLYHLAPSLGRGLVRSFEFALSKLQLRDYRAWLDGNGRAAARAEFDAGLPFDPCFRLESDDDAAPRQYRAAYDDDAAPRQYRAAYDDDRASWRRIDREWMSAAENLALQLGRTTNNTSLVLAIELIDDGRVLLLAGDAQLGNWRSWKDVPFSVTDANGTTRKVPSDDLLKETVFYKVGHHGSLNATMKNPGLESMTRADLAAMIPVDHKIAKGKHPKGSRIPPEPVLYRRLLEKARGRVLRSDTGKPKDDERPSTVPQAEWNRSINSEDIVVERIFIDYHLRSGVGGGGMGIVSWIRRRLAEAVDGLGRR